MVIHSFILLQNSWTNAKWNSNSLGQDLNLDHYFLFHVMIIIILSIPLPTSFIWYCLWRGMFLFCYNTFSKTSFSSIRSSYQWLVFEVISLGSKVVWKNFEIWQRIWPWSTPVPEKKVSHKPSLKSVCNSITTGRETFRCLNFVVHFQ